MLQQLGNAFGGGSGGGDVQCGVAGGIGLGRMRMRGKEKVRGRRRVGTCINREAKWAGAVRAWLGCEAGSALKTSVALVEDGSMGGMECVRWKHRTCSEMIESNDKTS